MAGPPCRIKFDTSYPAATKSNIYNSAYSDRLGQFLPRFTRQPALETARCRQSIIFSDIE